MNEQQNAFLADSLSVMGIDLSSVQQAQLLSYLNLLIKWNGTYNLTALREAERMISHHLLDSLSLLSFVHKAKNLLDVGSGGGMPGIPLAIACPDIKITLSDSNSKKTAFLRQAVLELGLSNTEVVTSRVENVNNRAFDIITSRAFAELADFVRVTHHLLAENGHWAAMKGIYPYEELAQLPHDITVDGVYAVDVPHIDAQRHIVMMSVKKGA